MTMVMLFSATLTISGATSSVHDEDFAAFHNALVEEFGAEFASNYHQAMQSVHKLYEIFPRNRVGDVMYPEYFGGMYVNDYGRLNVLIVEAVMMPFSADGLFSSLSADTNIRQVQFSLNELWATQNFLNVIIPAKRDIVPAATNAHAWYICVINNYVGIKLLSYSPYEINLFREEVFNSPVLVFSGFVDAGEQPSHPIETIQYSFEEYVSSQFIHILRLRPGDPIEITRDNRLIDTGSIGFYATRGSARGFVTAAHLGGVGGALQVGDVVLWHGVAIGTVEVVQLQHVDAAFIRLGVDDPSRFQLEFQNYSRHGNRVSTIPFDMPLVGAVVNLQARHNNSWGRVTIASFTGGNITNGLLADYATQQGDSGGLVYFQDMWPSNSLVVGIHIGRDRPGGYALISRATSINGRLATTLRR
ncbi:MAG: S1 family peptidase [Defluviitaleaceae bacterium]|nr:S1 family peptidase [Defluviitaleaceae bacterium]